MNVWFPLLWFYLFVHHPPTSLVVTEWDDNWIYAQIPHKFPLQWITWQSGEEDSELSAMFLLLIFFSLSLSLPLLIITPLINFNCWVWFHLQSGASVSVWFCHSDKIIRPVQCHRLSWGWVDGDRNGSFIGFIGFPEPWTFSYERIIQNKSIIFWYLFLNWPLHRGKEHPRG